MSAVAAIGEPERVLGLRFAGVSVFEASDASAARAAWETLAPETSVLILTKTAHATLERELRDREDVLCAVVPA